MAVNTQLGAPSASKLVQGKFTLARFFRCEASAAAPVSSSDLTGLQAWNISEPDIKFSAEIFHQGGGDEGTIIERGHTWPFTLSFLKGDAWDQLAALRGVTFGTSNDAILPLMKKNDYPEFILEAIVRDSDNETHLGSVIIPDLIIDNVSWDHPLDDSLFVVNCHTRRLPFLLTDGAELVYDVFTGDGSTVDFSLSSTPLNLTTATDWEYLDLDTIYYVKEKASTASTGTLKRSGYSESTGTLTASTAPAASTLVQVLYAKATA